MLSSGELEPIKRACLSTVAIFTVEEIRSLEEVLKLRKSELKDLQKAKVKAEKEKELFEKAEEKKVVDTLLSSERSVDEIMEFLKK
jgi:hypothetical protein